MVLSDRIEKETKELPKSLNLKVLEGLTAEGKLAAIQLLKAVLPAETKPEKPTTGATIPGKQTGGEKSKNDVINTSAQILAAFNAKKK